MTKLVPEQQSCRQVHAFRQICSQTTEFSCHKWEKSESAQVRPFAPPDLIRHISSLDIHLLRLHSAISETLEQSSWTAAFYLAMRRSWPFLLWTQSLDSFPKVKDRDDCGEAVQTLERASIVDIKVNICQTAISRINNVGVLQPRSPRSPNQWLI